jgi:hypothetical protein
MKFCDCERLSKGRTSIREETVLNLRRWELNMVGTIDFTILNPRLLNPKYERKLNTKSATEHNSDSLVIHTIRFLKIHCNGLKNSYLQENTPHSKKKLSSLF